ncbi:MULTISPECIES: transglycosylase domain-containing protein [unclassified Lacticaseibacillus]|uniref:transglycosylase domain-containing protein n=1 Tax=unclassified Lacticaseibacillus TaxID=2759744 RepID=UPI001940D6DB|nr:MULTISPECIES: PBP1A family penicillin-binding protein [unclassified Lacticaseibacillus]
MANTPSRMARKQARKPKKKRRWLTVLKTLLIIFVVGVVAGIGLFAYYASSAPKVTESALKSGGSSTLYDKSGNAITTLGVESRTYVNADEIPQTLKDAVVSIEDRRFYQERWGIDPIRIASAAMNNVVGRVTGRGSGLQGGSTLTQQLIKLSVFSTKASDQTLKRKAQEAWLAIKLEQSYSKEQILEFYINKVYMDNAQRGMGTAAKYYFNKDLKQLDLAQMALLAGMPQSPAGYDPYQHPEAATTRRNEVLSAMVTNKKISQAQADAAKAQPVTDGLVPQKTQTTNTGTDKVIDSYLTSVIKEVKAKTGVDPYSENLKIYTNIDMKAQQRLYDIVNTDKYVQFPNDSLQTAVTITNPNNGNVIAQIGGRKTGDVRLAYNRATQNDRSNGSTMKPLLDYGPAIEYLNYSTYQQMEDEPFMWPNSTVSVNNIDHQFLGRISIREALVKSRNPVAGRTLKAVGLSRGLNFLKGLGITLPENQRVYPSAIGASVTTEQEAAAYSAFANGGTYYKPTYVRKVVDMEGRTTNFTSNGTRAMKASTAYMITDMLKGVLTNGTGVYAKISGLQEAGKTGTSDYGPEELKTNPALSGLAKDIWFTGYTTQRTMSIWTGYDKPLQNGLGNGSNLIAQQIYKAMMSYMVDSENLPNKDWTKPSSVLVEHILKGSNPGTAVTGNTANTTRELYVRGHGPSTKTAVADTPSSSSSTSSTSSTTSSSESSSVSSSSELPSSSSSSAESSSEPSVSSSSASGGSPGPDGTTPQ